MITKAEIQSIDFAGNTCVVRMPYFESAAGGDMAIATAIFSNTPGTFNGYKVGDIVLVAFEDGQAQQPCVIGKLYLGMAEENKEARGTIKAEALTSSSTNSLPLSTKLTSDVVEDTVSSNNSANSFKTIKELAEAVQNNTEAIGIAGYQTYSLAEQIVGTWIDGKSVYRKVIKFTGDLTKNNEIKISTIGCGISDVLSIKHTTTHTPDRKNNSAYEFYYDPADGHHTVVGCRVDKVNGDIYICSCNDSWSNTVLIVMVEYTKA